MARTLHSRTFRAGRVGIPKAHARHTGTHRQPRHAGTAAHARHKGATGGHHATHASSHASHRARTTKHTSRHASHAAHAQAWGTHPRSHKGGAHTRHGTRRNLLGGWQGPTLPEDVQIIQQDDPFADPFSGGIDQATGQPVLDEMSTDGGLPFTDATH